MTEAEIREIARQEARAAVASLSGMILARSQELTVVCSLRLADALQKVFGHALEQFTADEERDKITREFDSPNVDEAR